MSYHVFTATHGGTCSYVGAFPDRAEADRAWDKAAGSILTNAEGVALAVKPNTVAALRTALERFAKRHFAALASTPAAPPKAPRRMVRKALSEGVVSPEASAPPSPPLATPCADDEHPVGVGAATEPPLPVPFDAPVVEPAPRSFAERAADLRAEIARGLRVAAAMKPPLPDMPDSTGIPLRPFTSPAFREALHAAKVAGPLHDEIERLEVALADATARAVAAEESLVAAEQTGKLHATTEALATIAKALRIPAGRDPEEIATRALASIKTYRLDAQVHGAEIERLREVIVELHARVKRGTRGTKPAPRVAETPVEQLWRRINELAAGVGR